MPPKLRVKPPKRSDLPIAGKPWGNADLPIDILLLTVEDCEFLSCFSFLDRPFKSYKEEVGPIYFGYTGNNGDQEKLKVALMKCSKGAAVPGGSLTAVKNAVRVLSPKAVFSVGTCSGLSSDKVKLGDVVVSAKLTTAAGFKSPVSRRMSDLVRDAPYGWVAPLENPDELEVEVHCDGDILSETPAARYGCADLHLQYPEAIALETEGEGVFAAAYDEKIEWVVVKGVARFVNQTELSRGEWMSFASTMAASVVAKMLNDPVVFQEWPHCNQDASFEPQMSSDAQGKLKRKCDISLTDHGLSSKKAQEEEEESKEHADISFTGHGLSQKKARGEEKESKQHSDSSLTHPDPSQKKAKEEEKEVKQHADVILKVVLKLACGGVWVAGTALILTKYRDDPEKMIQLFQQIALPAGVVLKYLFEGSITCILQVIDLHGWQTLWENFESGLLKKHLENVLITEDLYKLAKGDEIIMEVFLEETITAHLSVTSGLVARGGSFIHPEPSRKKEEEEEEVKQHADASCDVHVPPEARGRLHIKSSEDEKDASSDVEMPSEALARLHIKSSDDEKDSSFTHPDPSQKKAKEEEKEVKQYAASSHGNDDDRSDDSDIHPVIAVAGDDDDEFGDEEGKEEEVALEAERLERRTGIARYTGFVHWCKEEIRSNASGIITYLSSLIWNQPGEANFLAYFQPAERLNSEYILFLICYPDHLREIVKQEHVKEGITSCHVRSRTKMIPGQDKAFVFVSGGMCPVSLNGMDDFYLRFDGDAPFDAQLRVRLINDQEYCKVDFRSTRESTGNNLLCTMYFKLDHQEHKKRFVDKIISSPEEGGEDLKQIRDRLLEDISFTDHGLSQKKAREEEKESKEHADVDLRFPCKSGTPSTDDLSNIAENLGGQWKWVGRLLHVPEHVLDQIQHDNTGLSERCFQVLRSWMESADNPTYQSLAQALQNAGKRQLAEEYCGLRSCKKKKKFGACKSD